MPTLEILQEMLTKRPQAALSAVWSHSFPLYDSLSLPS